MMTKSVNLKNAWTLMVLLVFVAVAKAETILTDDIKDVTSKISNLPKEALILIDVDDTIITPISNLFRSNSPYRNLIDEIKAKKDQIKNFETILSNWRLQRKVKLVSRRWPQIINQAKVKHTVYALTKMDTGKFGNIESMEKWRYNELKSLGIQFTDSSLEDSNISLHRGIACTGLKRKGEVVELMIEQFKPKYILFIDDREDQVQEVIEICNKNNIKSTGIVYRGVDLMEGAPNSKAFEIQRRELLENHKWLEDDEILN